MDLNKKVRHLISTVLPLNKCLGKQSVDVSSEIWQLLLEYDVPAIIEVRQSLQKMGPVRMPV